MNLSAREKKGRYFILKDIDLPVFHSCSKNLLFNEVILNHCFYGNKKLEKLLCKTYSISNICQNRFKKFSIRTSNSVHIS